MVKVFHCHLEAVLKAKHLLNHYKPEKFMIDISLLENLSIFRVQVFWVYLFRSVSMLVLLEDDVYKPHEGKFTI